MTWRRIIIRYGGHWENLNYVGGDEDVLPVPLTGVTYSSLLGRIERIVQINLDLESCILYSLDGNGGRVAKLKINDDCDLTYLMDSNADPVIFVVLKPHPNVNFLGSSPGMNTNFTEFVGSSRYGGGKPFYWQTGPSFFPQPGCSSQSRRPHQRDCGVRNDAYVVNLGEQDPPLHVNDERDAGYDLPTTEQGSCDFQGVEGRRLDQSFMDYFGLSSGEGGDARRSWSSPQVSDDNVDGDPVEPNVTAAVPDVDIDSPGVPFRRWIIPAIAIHTPIDIDDTMSVEQSQELSLGAIFCTKKELTMAVGNYHLHNHAEYRTVRSDSMRYSVCCKIENCSFQLNVNGNGGIWRVWKLVEHDCRMDPNSSAPRVLPSRVLGAHFEKNIHNEKSTLVPRQIMAELKKDHAMDISYDLALRARNHAFAAIYGDSKDSFRQIPGYLHVLKSTNPGTITELQVDDEGSFMYVFYALGASISGFRYGRPVIVVDGTHLKGQYKGIVFVAVTKDGNNQIFPLAIGIGAVESEASWTWFLQQVRSAYGCPPELLIVSDGHPGIGNAVRAVFPTVAHGLCCYHLQQNLACYGQQIVNLFRQAAYSYSSVVCDRHLSAIAAVSPKAFEALSTKGVERWTRSKCTVRRYDIMNSNIVESFNSCILPARRLPVCSVLEVIRKIIENWFVERRAVAAAKCGPLTEHAAERLLRSISVGEAFPVDALDQWKFKVECNRKIFIVNLRDRTCTCKVFQYDLFPCSHATAAIRKIKHDQHTYVGECYKLENLCSMWGGVVYPVPHPSQWTLTTDVSKLKCEPPKPHKQAGRPKGKRHPSGAESSTRRKPQVCSRCRGHGHNRVHCTVPVPTTCSSDASQATPVEPKKRKCSVCGSTDHTRRKCSIYIARGVTNDRPDLNEPDPENC